MTHPFDLTGKLAIVTGAKRGIGYAMAEALAAAGANIVGVSATLEPEGSAVGAKLARQHHRRQPARVRSSARTPRCLRTVLGRGLVGQTERPPRRGAAGGPGSRREVPAAPWP
jgi:NAD(P)-dependent dehydrogenase (short-subunit alcohol dehydrogenase family)